MKLPLVSILMPAYKAEAWIAESINSALGQTWSNKEVIIVDDGSADQTLKIAQSFESKIVKVATQPNQGASAARNHALKLSQGDYIQWLDADDILAPDKIAVQLGRSEAVTPKQIYSGSWGQFHDVPGKSSFKVNALWRDLAPIEWLQTKMETNAWMAIESWLVSRELCDAAGAWNTELTADDDGEYFSRVIAASGGVLFVPGATVFCRTANRNSISRGAQTRRWLLSQFESLEKQVLLLLNLDNSPRSRAACVTLLQRWLIYFYPEHPDLVGRARNLAELAGGHLTPPTVRSKYRWIQSVFGTVAAKRAQQIGPAIWAKLRGPG